MHSKHASRQRRVRALRRLFLFATATAGIYLIWLAGYPFFALGKTKRKITWRSRCGVRWGGLAQRIIGIHLQVEGTPPTPPFFFVCNHLGYIDIPILIQHVHGCFIAKSEVARWPMISFIIRAMKNIIFVDRNNRKDLTRVNELISETLQANDGIILFAEGTSSGGVDILPFKPSLLHYAAEQNHPVHYATLSYRTPASEPHPHRAVCWWDDMELLPHLRKLLEIPAIYATLTFASESIQDSDRKVLANKLRNSMKKQFIPVIEAKLFG